MHQELKHATASLLISYIRELFSFFIVKKVTYIPKLFQLDKTVQQSTPKLSGFKPLPFYWFTITTVKNLRKAQAQSVPGYSQPSKTAHSFFWVSRTALSWSGFFLLHHITSPRPAQASLTWWLVVKRAKQKLQGF